jgi:adenosylhomocysteine nucleosidase
MPIVLFVSSTGAEFAGLARHFQPRDLGWQLDYAKEITNHGERWLLVANGAGADLAREAFRVASGQAAIDAVVSTGYCGALDPGLAPADVFVASEVRSPEGKFRSSAVQGPKSISGPMYGADRVVQSAGEKRSLRERTGAAAVDMESHALAQAAAEAGIPFYCVRAVTDVAGEDMRFDFNAARDADGRIRGSRVLMLGLRHPFDHLPELCKLGYRGWRASAQLGDFLAACRF